MRNRSIGIAVATAIPLASVLSAAVPADTVVLKDGRKVEGEITEETHDSVTIVISKAKIKRVEYSRPRDGSGGEDGDVSLWYTCQHEWGNNGVAVRTSRHLLVFDHVLTSLPLRSKGARKGLLNGGKTLEPSDIEGRSSLFFFTHDHADHYNRAIQKLAEVARRNTKVHFIVPAYMKGEFLDRRVRTRTTALGHEETREIDGVKVHSAFTGRGVRGCNYIVEADGLLIVYVNRCFEAEQLPPVAEFIRQLRSVVGDRRLDIACLDAALPFPTANTPRLIVPVHFKEETQEITEQFGKQTKQVRLAIAEEYVIPRKRLAD